jgi:hypothetical protein
MKNLGTNLSMVMVSTVDGIGFLNHIQLSELGMWETQTGRMFFFIWVLFPPPRNHDKLKMLFTKTIPNKYAKREQGAV